MNRWLLAITILCGCILAYAGSYLLIRTREECGSAQNGETVTVWIYTFGNRQWAVCNGRISRYLNPRGEPYGFWPYKIIAYLYFPAAQIEDRMRDPPAQD